MKTVTRTCVVLGALAPFLLIAGGCGKPTAGEVSGKVTFRGEPVIAGTVAFVSADGRVTLAMIEGGSYHAAKVPLGPAQITICVNEASSMPIVPLKMIRNGQAPRPQAPRQKPTPIPSAIRTPGGPAWRIRWSPESSPTTFRCNRSESYRPVAPSRFRATLVRLRHGR